MTPRGIAIALIWVGTLLLLGMLLYRFRLGAWSLEDEDIPPPSLTHRLIAGGGLLAATAGVGLFVWSYFDHGVG